LQTRPLPKPDQGREHPLRIEQALLSVTYQGKTCFLGNTLPFKLLCQLARRPNTYIPHEELLADVWQCIRSDAAVRSVVKTLRKKLRQAGLVALAQAIDGSESGHYSLKLPM
jgi:DNA-binding response OmpR family regulator